MGKYDDRTYEVGKGKPPIKGRFQPGVSGNSKGPKRKKKAGDATIPVLLQEALNEMVTVTINGRDMRVPKKQAIIIQTINDALTGTPTQRIKILKVLHGIGAFDPAIVDHRPDPELEQERIADFLDSLIDESLKDEANHEAFANFERRYDPESGKERWFNNAEY